MKLFPILKVLSIVIRTLTLLCLFTILCLSEAQQRTPGGRPPARKHTIIESVELKTIPAEETLLYEQIKKFKKSNKERKIEANGIPEHKVGRFPSRHNPNEIREQTHQFSLPIRPEPSTQPIPLHNETVRGPPNTPFGIALNGVLFDPGTAEFYMGDRHADWNYEALGGSVLLGLDENHGHVQPNGSYHYHGLPIGLLKNLGVKAKEHSPLVGYAMDGYPIYALYGYSNPKDPDSGVKKLKSSFRLKKGKRPNPPGGKYDGAFSKDYKYVEGLGDLDMCNGRFTVTKEFPKGTYAYFLTEDWPVIPRYFKAEPLRLRGGPGYHRDGRPPPPRRTP